jgi:type IV pilus assembly protein PilC
MSLYAYKAKDKEGKIISDVTQAGSAKEAASMIRSENLQVLSLKSIDKKSMTIFGGGIPMSEKASFCRFLATMLRAGLPLPEAIDIIQQETKSQRLQEILFDISFNLKKGNTLFSVLTKYKGDFDSVFLTMIKAGEESGTLEKSFDYLAKQTLASYELTQKVKGAMGGVAVVMVVFVLPKMSEVFMSFNVELPAATKFILNVGKTIGANMALTFAMVFVMLFIIVLLFLIKSTRSLIFAYFMRLPVVRTVMVQLDVARFARTLSTLLKSGVPIMGALDVASDMIKEPRLHKEALAFSASVAKGESLSDVLVKHKKIFPATMVQTIRAGEKTGSLEIVLEELAAFYEIEVDYGLKRATSLIEPIIMIVIGIAVGVMVVMMIMPIYSIVGDMGM